jgi:RimJ/RimL family protein N-acetyltransferase
MTFESDGILTSGRRIILEPITIEHYEFLYDLFIDEDINFHWRLAGLVPPKRTFQRTLWDAVLCQFVVLNRNDMKPAGLVQSYKADLHLGHAYVGGAFIRAAQRTGIPIEGFRVFIDYLLSTWSLRKLYFEYPGYNEPQFASLSRLPIVKEASLVDYGYFNGRYWDWTIFTLDVKHIQERE